MKKGWASRIGIMELLSAGVLYKALTI